MLCRWLARKVAANVVIDGPTRASVTMANGDTKFVCTRWPIDSRQL